MQNNVMDRAKDYQWWERKSSGNFPEYSIKKSMKND